MWEVEPSGCWLWQGAPTGNNGYGQVTIGGIKHAVHRLMYRLAHGPIPEGMDVMHSCDTPLCINPAHLSAGTHDDNMADMRNKGRSATKLTAHQVRDIRTWIAAGKSNVYLGRVFGVSASTISRIRTGEGWQHVG